MCYCCRFLKLFGYCLPNRKGKGRADPVIDSHREDPKIRTDGNGDEEKDSSEAREFCEKENSEPSRAYEEPDDRNAKSAIESEPGEIPDGKETVPILEETQTRDEGSPNECEENKEGYAVKAIDPQEDDYKWEVSCCGMDIPMAK